MNQPTARPWVALACGGTGGHLFPGIAVGEVLAAHGCAVTLMISSKEIDRRGASLSPQFECITLPAVGLERGREFDFLRSGWKSYRTVIREFRARRPAAVLAMGGFTAAAPILAGRRMGAATFLHESNSIPGRANRWLARWVDRAFVGFPQTAARLRHCGISVTGTPVRARFGTVVSAHCRVELGLDPDEPVLLVMGGSQGASAINDLVLTALPKLHQQVQGLQIIHLTGVGSYSRVEQAYRGWPGRVLVRDFAAEMETIMGAATLAITRAGASTLAELAASGLASVLVPYPRASDNHQVLQRSSPSRHRGGAHDGGSGGKSRGSGLHGEGNGGRRGGSTPDARGLEPMASVGGGTADCRGDHGANWQDAAEAGGNRRRTATGGDPGERRSRALGPGRGQARTSGELPWLRMPPAPWKIWVGGFRGQP